MVINKKIKKCLSSLKKNDDENRCWDIINGLRLTIKYKKSVKIVILEKKKIVLKNENLRKKKWKLKIIDNVNSNKVNSTKSQFQKPPHNNSWPAQYDPKKNVKTDKEKLILFFFWTFFIKKKFFFKTRNTWYITKNKNSGW